MSRKPEHTKGGLNKPRQGNERTGIADYARLAIALVFLSGCGGAKGGPGTAEATAIKSANDRNVVNICYGWHAKADSTLPCDNLKRNHYPPMPENDGLFSTIMDAARFQGLNVRYMTECTSGGKDDIHIYYFCDELNGGKVIFTITRGKVSKKITVSGLNSENPLDFYLNGFGKLLGKKNSEPAKDEESASEKQPDAVSENVAGGLASDLPATPGTATNEADPLAEPVDGMTCLDGSEMCHLSEISPATTASADTAKQPDDTGKKNDARGKKHARTGHPKSNESSKKSSATAPAETKPDDTWKSDFYGYTPSSK
jgi:hypothetical protein